MSSRLLYVQESLLKRKRSRKASSLAGWYIFTLPDVGRLNRRVL